MQDLEYCGPNSLAQGNNHYCECDVLNNTLSCHVDGTISCFKMGFDFHGPSYHARNAKCVAQMVHKLFHKYIRMSTYGVMAAGWIHCEVKRIAVEMFACVRLVAGS